MRYVLVLLVLCGCGVGTFRATGEGDMTAVVARDMSGADLVSVDLTGEDLASVDMSEADQAAADLAQTDMSVPPDLTVPVDMVQPPDLAVPSDFAGCLASLMPCASAPSSCCPGRGCYPAGSGGAYVCCVPAGSACGVNGDCCYDPAVQISCKGAEGAKTCQT